MPEADNQRTDTNIELGASQLELALSDVPQSERRLKRLRKPRNLPRTEAPLFTQRPYEMMATGAPIISATQAYLKSPDWNEYEPGRLYFQKPFGKKRYIEFYILNKQEHQPEFIASQAEREILDRYGVMAARLHAVFATYAASQTEPWKEPFVLRGSELIKTLQVYKTKKLTKSQKLKAIADLAWVVGTLGAIIHWYEGELNLCVRERSLLWIVSVQEYTQPNLLGETDEIYEVTIRVQPGLWTYNFLNFKRERQRKALYQYGFIPKQLFDLDPHRQKLATNLALYIIQNSRAHTSGVYTVESLLSSVLPQCQIEQAVNSYQYGWKFKERVDEALLVLKDKVGIGIEFDDETYPMWLRPAWVMPDELSCLSTRERNQRLLGVRKLPDNYIKNHLFPALLTFSLPKLIQEHLDEFESRKFQTTKRISKGKARKSCPPSKVSASELAERPPQTMKSSLISELPEPRELTGAMVKQARTASRMSQREVARAIGMSQSWVRDIENDWKEKPIPQEHALKLKTLLGLD
jgi:DNA-binding transcriptional regulator YiaG